MAQCNIKSDETISFDNVDAMNSGIFSLEAANVKACNLGFSYFQFNTRIYIAHPRTPVDTGFVYIDLL